MPQTIEDRLSQLVNDFRRDLNQMACNEVDLLEQETRIQDIVNQMGRELLGEVFRRADVRIPEILFNDVRWGNRKEVETTYTSKFGDMRVVRSVYSKSGGGPVLIPLELRLGIVEGRYPPGVARVMTRARACLPAVEAEQLLKEAGVAAVSSSTLNRIPKAIAARYENMRDQINEQLREMETVPDGAVTVQAGLDGVMVPQDGEYANPRGRKTETPKAPRHEVRYGAVNSDGPANEDGLSGRAWHEASVATLAYFDEDGNRIRTIYLARMPESKMETLALDLEEELINVLAKRPDLNVCFA